MHHSSLSWYITPLWILRSYFSNFGLKDPINIPILRLSIALVKICYIPHVISETTSQFFIKFCITLYNLPSTPTYLRGRVCIKSCFNPLSANSTKWSYTLKQHSNYRQIVWACLTTLWGCHMVTLRNLHDFEKKLAKQVLYFLYTYTIYSVNTGKRQCSTWKHQTTSTWSFEVSLSKVAF